MADESITWELAKEAMRAIPPDLWKNEQLGWDSKRNVPVECMMIEHKALIGGLVKQGYTTAQAQAIIAVCREFGLDALLCNDGRIFYSYSQAFWKFLGEQATPDVPHWDQGRLILTFRGREIKRLSSRTKAKNQVPVLDTFQEEGWPAKIDSPIRPNPEQEPKRQMHETIDGLNRGLTGIWFRADGTGEGIVWEPCDEEAAKRPIATKAKTTKPAPKAKKR